MITTLTDNMAIEPMYLGPRIKHRLMERLRDKYENTCSLEYGHIRRVVKIISCRNTITNAMSSVVFSVRFQIESKKISKNDIVSGICSIATSGKGIVIEVDTDINVFVMASRLKKTLGKDIEFDREKCVFVDSQGDVILQDGDIVNVTIAALQYSDGIFKYVGDNVIVQ